MNEGKMQTTTKTTSDGRTTRSEGYVTHDGIDVWRSDEFSFNGRVFWRIAKVDDSGAVKAAIELTGTAPSWDDARALETDNLARVRFMASVR